jgi:hypothetical protein
VKDLEGKLSVFEASAVLQMVHNARLTGRLELIQGMNRARVFFEDGNISFTDLKNRPAKLGESLVRSGAIKRDALERVLREAGSPGKLGERLVTAGLVTEEDIRAAVAVQIQEVIYEAIQWKRGRFVFDADVLASGEDIRNELPLDHLILEGARRVDESLEEDPR